AAVSAGRTRLSIVRASMRKTVSRGRVEIPPTHPPESQCGRDGRESDAVGAGGGIGKVGTSDAALVRRVQTGDTRAYADLVARYRDRLGRYALLKHVEDLEYEDMARLTGAGVSALKMRVKRAREQLRAILKEAERV